MFSFRQSTRLPKRRNRPIPAGWKPRLEALEDRTLLSGFVDNFEGPALNSFWSTSNQSGSISFPSAAQAHSGQQSVQFNSVQGSQQKTIQLQHAFASPVFGTFSVWMYDTGAGQLS